MIIVPTDYETLTLTTCYPFEYIGDASDRFIVYTKLVSKPDLERQLFLKESPIVVRAIGLF
ncbi:Sortase family protein [Bacillus sp. 166amftsu]|nr:Sortase family protein [Bacillus sp. 166amftsu]